MDLPRDFGLAMSVMFRGLQAVAIPFDQQLRGVGLRPEEIGQLVITHLHVDHTSGLRLLPNATFICAREEWDATQKGIAARSGYVRHHLPPASRMQLLDFQDEAEGHGSFAKTIDFLGDGSVRLVFTPGHTPGHQSALLRLEDGRQVLLVGDAAYTLRNVREQILPMITADDTTARQWLRELKAFTEAEPGAILVPPHDPTRGISSTGARAAKRRSPDVRGCAARRTARRRNRRAPSP